MKDKEHILIAYQHLYPPTTPIIPVTSTPTLEQSTMPVIGFIANSTSTTPIIMVPPTAPASTPTASQPTNVQSSGNWAWIPAWWNPIKIGLLRKEGLSSKRSTINEAGAAETEGGRLFDVEASDQFVQDVENSKSDG